MGLYAVIDGGVVKNIIVCDAQFASQIGHDLVLNIENFETKPNIGCTYDGVSFSVPPKIIPDVTPRQIRIALLMSGVNEADIDAALDSLPEPTKTTAKIEWQYSISFSRANALVGIVGSMLGWSDEQLDDLWLLASGL